MVSINANRKRKCLTSSKNSLSQAFQTTSDFGCTSGHIRSPRLDDRSMVRNCTSTISPAFLFTTRNPPTSSLSQMVLNEWQKEEGAKGAAWESSALFKGASQAATAEKRKASFSRFDCWRNLAPRVPAVYSGRHVPYFMSALLQPFIRGFIKISTPQQLTGNTHLLRLIRCNAHLLSADRTVPHRAARKPFFCLFLLSALCSCEHLPAPQIGRTLCQVCPQMAPWCSHRELHALLVRRLRWKRQPLRDARAVSEGVWETRYTPSLSRGFVRPIISD